MNTHNTTTTTTTTTTSTTTNMDTNEDTNIEASIPDETQADKPRRGLSVSNNFEDALTNWNPSFSVVDILKQLHAAIQQQGVDVEHADDEYAIPTVGTFWRLYTCEDAGTYLFSQF
jgi:hypothetical protein